MTRPATHIVYCAFIALAFLAGGSVTRAMMEATLPDSSVYLIGAVTITDEERLPEYQAIAGPLAASTGGYVPLAYAAPMMIEGSAPSEGFFFIERYDSLEGLQAFVSSPEFIEAKKLRDEVADVHFMLWLPALPPDALPH